MSDRSGSGSDEELDYEYEERHHHHRGQRHHDYYSSSSDHSDQEDSESQEEDDKTLVDISKLHLCVNHKPGEMTRECESCTAALAIIKDKSTIKMLIGDGQSGSGTVLPRIMNFGRI